MAYLAVNKDGTEAIFPTKPFKVFGTRNKWAILAGTDYGIILPKGSIRKLIGRELTWKDEPIEIKEE